MEEVSIIGLDLAKNVFQVRMDWFAEEDQAVAALITLEASKRQRGYWVEPQQLAMVIPPESRGLHK